MGVPLRCWAAVAGACVIAAAGIGLFAEGCCHEDGNDP